MRKEITKEQMLEFISEQIANGLTNKEQMIKELKNALSIEEIDGKLNCSCKIMYQFDKELINKVLNDE